MTKKEILEKIEKEAVTDGKDNDFMNRYTDILNVISILPHENKLVKLEALKQLYQLYKDCGGLDD